MRDKLDELYNYFDGVDDKTKVNQAWSEEPSFVYLMGFMHTMDVKLFFLILLTF